MADTKLRVGVVGAGANTRSRHIPGLQAIDGVEVVSVANRSRSSGEKVAQQFGIANVYDDWRSLVEAPETNAIMIGTWPYLHCPITLAAIAAGKHVLTEARMAMNAAEARQMLAASRAHPELTCMVVPSPFTFHVDAAVQQRVKDGYLGDVIGIDLRGPGPEPPNFPGQGGTLLWRQDRELSGYNILAMGIWYEALMRWVGEATSVMARTKVVSKQRVDPESGEPRPATVPDYVDVIAEMACGAIARLHFSNVTGMARPAEIWLYGSEGTLYYDNGSRTLSGGRRGDKALAPIEIPPEQQGAWRVEEEFVNAVRGIEPVRRTTFADGVRYMEFTEAVTRSAQSGAAVPLPLVEC